MFSRIVILTGAGISAESGLKTFRGGDGLWEGHKVEDVATPEAFMRNPKLVHQFYNARRAQLKTVKPNAAHIALAELEEKFPGEVLLITQNVDDLHERAGSKNLLHMHGELKKARHVMNEEDIIHVTEDLPHDGLYRPHIVWFGEMPLYMEAIYRALHSADLFISIGTSGNVYPAAGFIQEIRYKNMADSVEINLEPSMGASLFDEAILGPATETVPAFVKKLLKESGA